jgi:hypothetical protein
MDETSGPEVNVDGRLFLLHALFLAAWHPKLRPLVLVAAWSVITNPRGSIFRKRARNVKSDKLKCSLKPSCHLRHRQRPPPITLVVRCSVQKFVVRSKIWRSPPADQNPSQPPTSACSTPSQTAESPPHRPKFAFQHRPPSPL